MKQQTLDNIMRITVDYYSASEFDPHHNTSPCYIVPKEKYTSLSNSHWHLANADVIANEKSKTIVSCHHFFADVIFSATSKVQN